MLRNHDHKYVFFSYKRDESGALVHWIQKFSLDVICMNFDLAFLVPGKPWKPQLEEFIARSDVFVFIISPGSVASFSEHSDHPTCAWELNTALRMGKDIIPVFWGPVSDHRQLPAVLSELHYVDFERFRISDLSDESAFGFAFDRLRLGIYGDENAWADESMEWYNKLEAWRRTEYHEDMLLTESEMRKFETFLRRTPPKQAHILDHPLMMRFIRLNRNKWDPAYPSWRHS